MLIKEKLERIFIAKSSRFLIFISFLLLTIFSLSFYDQNFFAKSVIAIFVIVLAWIIAKKYITYFLYFLIFWYSVEIILLKFIPKEYIIFVKYGPEILLYLIFIFTLIYKIKISKFKFIQNPINLVLLGFLLVGMISILINKVPVFIGFLGLRQLLRFTIVYYLILYADLQKKQIRNLIFIFFIVFSLQIFLGLLQKISGGKLDQLFLLSSDFYIGSNIFLEGVQQYWDQGSRIFGSLKRYNEYASFLVVGISILFAMIYEQKNKKNKFILMVLLFLSFIALLFTYARSSWIAVFISLTTIILLKKNKKHLILLASGIILVLIYIGVSIAINKISIYYLTYQPKNTFVERLLEPFSRDYIEGSFRDYGRLYFWVKTPKLVMQHPFFGVGPGMYGGGVAAALGNRKVYNENDIAFGIYGENGQIDNNWLSIWGEFGSFGLILFLMIFIKLYKGAKRIYTKKRNWLKKSLALGLQGLIIGAIVLGLFSPYYEIRAFAFYFWLVAGLTFA